MSYFPQNSTIASRVDHSPMYTATDLVVDVILEAARATVGDGNIPARTANEQRVPANVEEVYLPALPSALRSFPSRKLPCRRWWIELRKVSTRQNQQPYFDEIREAQRLMESNQANGKIIVKL